MSRLIALLCYSIFVSVISERTTKSGFLLLGGRDNDGNTLDNVEAYRSDFILPSVPSLPLPLYAPIAQMTESGATYLAGGMNNDKTFMLSNLSSSVWEGLEARMPIPMRWTASVVVENIILVLGGSRDSIQMLDTNKSLPTWTILNQILPEPLTSHSATVYEGQVIIVTSDGVTYTTSVTSIINDTQLDWVKGKLPGVEDLDGVDGPSIELVEGKLVAVLRSKVFTKTTMDSQWVQLEPLPQEKGLYPSIGSVGGNIVIAGGKNGLTFSASATVFMWFKGDWKEVTSLKIPRCEHATVQLHRRN